MHFCAIYLSHLTATNLACFLAINVQPSGQHRPRLAPNRKNDPLTPTLPTRPIEQGRPSFLNPSPGRARHLPTTQGRNLPSSALVTSPSSDLLTQYCPLQLVLTVLGPSHLYKAQLELSRSNNESVLPLYHHHLLPLQTPCPSLSTPLSPLKNFNSNQPNMPLQLKLYLQRLHPRLLLK